MQVLSAQLTLEVEPRPEAVLCSVLVPTHAAKITASSSICRMARTMDGWRSTSLNDELIALGSRSSSNSESRGTKRVEKGG